MSRHESSLPETWVERIWATMRATYGAAFDRQWQCPEGEDPVRHVASLKAHWGRELSRYQPNPDAIRYALENLPKYPPNLIEFREICNRRPDPPVPQLPAPKPDPERLAAALSPLAGIKAKDAVHNPRAWAHSLHAQIQAGRKVSPAIRAMVADVMRMEGRA